MSTLERAIAIAAEAHAGQVDKAGAPYILHPLRVMMSLATEEERIVGVLHDVVEDCPEWPLRRLASEGFSNTVLDALASVTKLPEEEQDYDAFIRRAADSVIGRRVKIADLNDNLDLSRIANPTEGDLRRLAKYRRALEVLRGLPTARFVKPPMLSLGEPFAPSAIVAVDVGSPKAGKLGWAVLPSGVTGRSIDELVSHIAQALQNGPVALGFEAPMWVPARADEMAITSARIGEGNRAWSAGAGSGALATGLVVMVHVLAKLRAAAPLATATLDWRDCLTKPQSLFLWEAFVTAQDKGLHHEDDALLAAKAFAGALTNLDGRQRITPEPCLNLLGAALLRTGWSSDLSLLSAEVLVLRQ